ncbi:aminotransferase class I/II-fold pyridoxal phosphate-dependent enzyme [bacterium]|nr:aminotransferase class I/II-fold pyridoxal phosphate-dependent enzyme [bacterium]
MHKRGYSRLLDKVPPSGIRKFFDLVMGQKGIISLGVGEPDFMTPWVIRERAIQVLEKGMTSYSANQGIPELCESIRKYVANRFNCQYDPKTEMIITNGVSEGMDIVLRALLNPGDDVLIPEPSYVCYSPLTVLTGANVVSVPTHNSDFVLDATVLEASITKQSKVLILSSPSNPTGRIIPKEQLEEIAKVVEKYDLWVISDEIYAELSFDDDYVSFASLPGMKDRTLLMNGFSKAWAMTGWRLGYVCGPSDVISRALKIHQYSALCAPTISQFAGVVALDETAVEVEQMVQSYKERRNFMVKRFSDIGLWLPHPDGAFYCFPSIKSTGLTAEDFALGLLQEYNVAVVPGTAFGQGGEGHIRCCYATSMKQLEEALDKMSKFVKKVRK